jgi:hypothetical protein
MSLSIELSFPRPVQFLKWSEKSEEEVVFLELLHNIFNQKKKMHKNMDRSLQNSKRESDTFYTSFNDTMSLPPPSAYEVRPRVLYRWTDFPFGNKQFIVNIMVHPV